MTIITSVSGFLFLFILVLWLSIGVLGFPVKIGNYDSDAHLQKIINNPKKWEISIVLGLISHGCVVALAILLFIIFSSYNIILGVVWTAARLGEGLVLFYYENNYWGLLNISRKYSGTNGVEKKSLRDIARSILILKESRYQLSQLFWAIGTFSFSILLVIYSVVPIFIGWFGILASIFFGLYNGMYLVTPKAEKPSSEVLSGIAGFIGGVCAMLFEVSMGGWLLFFS